MAQLDKENIRNLSHLCRLTLSEEELEHFQRDITKILGYVAQLSEVDLSNLSPHSHIEEQAEDFLRPDSVQDLLPRETFLKQAPKHIGGMVAVPPILKSS